jgi:hypothetical protein
MLVLAALLGLAAAVRWAPDVLGYQRAQVTVGGSGLGQTGTNLIDCYAAPLTLSIVKGNSAQITVTCNNRLGASAPGTAHLAVSNGPTGNKDPSFTIPADYYVNDTGVIQTISVSTPKNASLQTVTYRLSVTVTTSPLTYSRTYQVTVTVTN